MKVNREELLGCLMKLRPGLARREIIEQQSHFIFTGRNIVTYNGQLSISHPFDSPEIRTSVKAEDLYKCLNQMKGESVWLKQKDDMLEVKGSTSHGEFSTLAEEVVWEEIQSLEEKMTAWEPFPQDAYQALSLCMFSCSRDASEGMSMCVAVMDDMVLSSDRRRVSVYELGSKLNTFLLVGTDVAELVKFNVTEYCMSEGWVHFKDAEGVTISITPWASIDYPKDLLLQSFDDFHKNHPRAPSIELPSQGIADAVNLVTVMVDDQVQAIERSIKMTIEGGEILLEGRKARGVMREKVVGVEYNGDPISFHIHPDFILQILDKATTFRVGVNEGLFISGNFAHLLSFTVP